MAEKLKPCPFCGGKAIIEKVENDTPEDPFFYIIHCTKCPAGTTFGDDSEVKKKTIAAWNRRAEYIDKEDKLNRIERRNLKYQGFGEKHGVSEWAQRLRLPRSTVWRYLQAGLTIERIVELRGIEYIKE